MELFIFEYFQILFDEPVISDSENKKTTMGHLERMDSVRMVTTIAWKVPDESKKRTTVARMKRCRAPDLEDKKVIKWTEKARDIKRWKETIKLCFITYILRI